MGPCFAITLLCVLKLSKANLFYRYMMEGTIQHTCWGHLLEHHCEDWPWAALQIIFGSNLIQILKGQMKVFNLYILVSIAESRTTYWLWKQQAFCPTWWKWWAIQTRVEWILGDLHHSPRWMRSWWLHHCKYSRG